MNDQSETQTYQTAHGDNWSQLSSTRQVHHIVRLAYALEQPVPCVVVGESMGSVWALEASATRMPHHTDMFE